MNLELKRVSHAILVACIANEAVTVRSADHQEAIAAPQGKRPPVFKRD